MGWKVHAALLGGSLVLLIYAWIAPRLAKRRRYDDAADLSRIGHRYTFEGHDDALRVRSIERNREAERKRFEASRITSGWPGDAA